MKKISKHLFDFVVEIHALRPCLAWIATNIRQQPKIRKIVNKINPNTDPWVPAADEFADLRKNYSVDFKRMIKRMPKKPIGLIAIKDDHVISPFIIACEILNLTPLVFDPSHSNVLSKIKESDCEFYLTRQNHVVAVTREMFAEKEDVIRDCLKKVVYPNRLEARIYEAKRSLAYFLQAENLPHPKTFISYSRAESFAFIESCSLPLVFKSKNGAGSTGVEIVRTREQGIKLVKRLFDGHYVNKALSDYRDIDYGYIFFQEYIKNVREFRVIKIGDSWFGHEKSKSEEQEFMSGSGINHWTPPPHDLLEFCSHIANKYGFTSMCFDIFKDDNDRYLVNELQTWFGCYDPSQMYIDEVPGRYRKINGVWVFEHGLFNDLQSLPLRLVSYINEEF